MLSSGTVGAAMEGAILGRRAVAVSFPFFQGWDNWTDADVDSAVQVASTLIKALLSLNTQMLFMMNAGLWIS